MIMMVVMVVVMMVVCVAIRVGRGDLCFILLPYGLLLRRFDRRLAPFRHPTEESLDLLWWRLGEGRAANQ